MASSPKSAVVEGRIYSIEFVEDILGLCSFPDLPGTKEERSILVKDGRMARKALAHELTHALARELGWEPDEDMTDKIGLAVLRLLRRNKKLTRWLLEG